MVLVFGDMTKTGDKLRFVPLSKNKKKEYPLSVWLSREGGRERNGPSAPDLQSARRRSLRGDPLTEWKMAAKILPYIAILARFCVCLPLRLPPSVSSLPRATHRPKNVIV